MTSLRDCLLVFQIMSQAVQCGCVSQHNHMLTLKTVFILSRSSSLQGSALGLLVQNDYPHIGCRERCHWRVYGAASTAAKPGLHGVTLSIQAAPGLLRQQRL